MVIIRMFPIFLFVQLAFTLQSQDLPLDGNCPVDERNFFSYKPSEKAQISLDEYTLDTLPLRIFVIYCSDDTAQYNMTKQEFEGTLYHMVSRGNRLNHISGISDTLKSNAYEIIGMKGIPIDSFHNPGFGGQLLTSFFLEEDGVLDQERQDFECANAQIAAIVGPHNLNSPNGVASRYYFMIRSFWVNSYALGIQQLADAQNEQDSTLAFVTLERTSNTFFHELGHCMGGKHFIGEGDDETVAPYLGQSNNETTFSLMYGAYGTKIQHFSNIHGADPLSDGIVDHASTMIRARFDYHTQKPAFRINGAASVDTIYSNSVDTLFLDATSNYPLWDSLGETTYTWFWPDGSSTTGPTTHFTFPNPVLPVGTHTIYVQAERNCSFGPSGQDSLAIVVAEPIVSAMQTHKDIKVIIFPNPATNRLTIFAENSLFERYTLRDLSGKVMKYGILNGAGSSTQIEVPQLLPGFYFIDLHDQKRGLRHTSKVIIH